MNACACIYGDTDPSGLDFLLAVWLLAIGFLLSVTDFSKVDMKEAAYIASIILFEHA